MNYIECPCIEVTQPIGTFYLAAMGAKELAEITYADVRRIEDERRDIEVYLGIQRPLSSKRVAEISTYVNMEDASFPSSVILAIESIAKRDPNVPLIAEEDQETGGTSQPAGQEQEVRNIIFEKDRSVLRIRKDAKVAKVIDGQHRIEGLKQYTQAKPFIVLTTIFVDMDIEDQAIVFATINKTQTKVNKSLVYDLFEYAHSRSPQKTTHNIAKFLNDTDGSPFRNMIKVLGVADDEKMETITQATFCECLMSYISKKPMIDRNEFRLGKTPPLVEGKTNERLFLRNLFLEKRDAEITRIVWNYFAAVQSRWPRAWGEKAAGNILNKSTGFIALMRFFRSAYLRFGKIGEIISQEQFSEIFSRIEIPEFSPDRYKPGATGQIALYKELLEKSQAPLIA
jgi:DGQHR domain-containing protein